MSSHELLETALRVLVACISGQAPASADEETLRSEYFTFGGLPIDELACQIVNDLGGRALPKRAMPGTDEQPDKRVA